MIATTSRSPLRISEKFLTTAGSSSSRYRLIAPSKAPRLILSPCPLRSIRSDAMPLAAIAAAIVTYASRSPAALCSRSAKALSGKSSGVVRSPTSVHPSLPISTRTSSARADTVAVNNKTKRNPLQSVTECIVLPGGRSRHKYARTRDRRQIPNTCPLKVSCKAGGEL